MRCFNLQTTTLDEITQWVGRFVMRVLKNTFINGVDNYFTRGLCFVSDGQRIAGLGFFRHRQFDLTVNRVRADEKRLDITGERRGVDVLGIQRNGQTARSQNPCR